MCHNYVAFLETGLNHLKDRVLPTLNLPVKSHDSQKSTERRHLYVVKDIPEKQRGPLYRNITDFLRRLKNLNLSSWNIEVIGQKASFKQMEDPYATPKYEIVLAEDLSYTCVVFGWPLPNDNERYKNVTDH